MKDFVLISFTFPHRIRIRNKQFLEILNAHKNIYETIVRVCCIQYSGYTASC